MAWMFRWLTGLIARLRADEGRGASNAWVEPSNAITRAILAGAVGELPMIAEPAAAEAEIVPMPQRAPAPTSRTAARVRRRRASRAA